jgi:hypothetical protein
MANTDSRTHVVLVLDETGSMEPIRDETVGALKEWLGGLKTDLPRATPVTFVRFNSARIARTIDSQPLEVVSATEFDDYAPNHMTPLHDAVGQTILATDGTVKGEDGVLFTVITDGHENASQEFSAKQIRELIDARKAKGWKFMFLGADIDAYGLSRQLGVDDAVTVSMDKRFMRAAMQKQREKAAYYEQVRRREGARAAAAQTSYSAEDKQDLGERPKE